MNKNFVLFIRLNKQYFLFWNSTVKINSDIDSGLLLIIQ